MEDVLKVLGDRENLDYHTDENSAKLKAITQKILYLNSICEHLRKPTPDHSNKLKVTAKHGFNPLTLSVFEDCKFALSAGDSTKYEAFLRTAAHKKTRRNKDKPVRLINRAGLVLVAFMDAYAQMLATVFEHHREYERAKKPSLAVVYPSEILLTPAYETTVSDLLTYITVAHSAELDELGKRTPDNDDADADLLTKLFLWWSNLSSQAVADTQNGVRNVEPAESAVFFDTRIGDVMQSKLYEKLNQHFDNDRKYKNIAQILRGIANARLEGDPDADYISNTNTVIHDHLNNEIAAETGATYNGLDSLQRNLLQQLLAIDDFATNYDQLQTYVSAEVARIASEHTNIHTQKALNLFNRLVAEPYKTLVRQLRDIVVDFQCNDPNNTTLIRDIEELVDFVTAEHNAMQSEDVERLADVGEWTRAITAMHNLLITQNIFAPWNKQSVMADLDNAEKIEVSQNVYKTAMQISPYKDNRLNYTVRPPEDRTTLKGDYTPLQENNNQKYYAKEYAKEYAYVQESCFAMMERITEMEVLIEAFCGKDIANEATKTAHNKHAGTIRRFAKGLWAAFLGVEYTDADNVFTQAEIQRLNRLSYLTKQEFQQLKAHYMKKVDDSFASRVPLEEDFNGICQVAVALSFLLSGSAMAFVFRMLRGPPNLGSAAVVYGQEIQDPQILLPMLRVFLAVVVTVLVNVLPSKRASDTPAWRFVVDSLFGRWISKKLHTSMAREDIGTPLRFFSKVGNIFAIKLLFTAMNMIEKVLTYQTLADLQSHAYVLFDAAQNGLTRSFIVVLLMATARFALNRGYVAMVYEKTTRLLRRLYRTMEARIRSVFEGNAGYILTPISVLSSLFAGALKVIVTDLVLLLTFNAASALRRTEFSSEFLTSIFDGIGAFKASIYDRITNWLALVFGGGGSSSSPPQNQLVNESFHLMQYLTQVSNPNINEHNLLRQKIYGDDQRISHIAGLMFDTLADPFALKYPDPANREISNALVILNSEVIPQNFNYSTISWEFALNLYDDKNKTQLLFNLSRSMTYLEAAEETFLKNIERIVKHKVDVGADQQTLDNQLQKISVLKNETVSIINTLRSTLNPNLIQTCDQLLAVAAETTTTNAITQNGQLQTASQYANNLQEINDAFCKSWVADFFGLSGADVVNIPTRFSQEVINIARDTSLTEGERKNKLDAYISGPLRKFAATYKLSLTDIQEIVDKTYTMAVKMVEYDNLYNKLYPNGEIVEYLSVEKTKELEEYKKMMAELPTLFRDSFDAKMEFALQDNFLRYQTLFNNSANAINKVMGAIVEQLRKVESVRYLGAESGALRLSELLGRTPLQAREEAYNVLTNVLGLQEIDKQLALRDYMSEMAEKVSEYYVEDMFSAIVQNKTEILSKEFGPNAATLKGLVDALGVKVIQGEKTVVLKDHILEMVNKIMNALLERQKTVNANRDIELTARGFFRLVTDESAESSLILSDLMFDRGLTQKQEVLLRTIQNKQERAYGTHAEFDFLLLARIARLVLEETDDKDYKAIINDFAKTMATAAASIHAKNSPFYRDILDFFTNKISPMTEEMKRLYNSAGEYVQYGTILGGTLLTLLFGYKPLTHLGSALVSLVVASLATGLEATVGSVKTVAKLQKWLQEKPKEDESPLEKNKRKWDAEIYTNSVTRSHNMIFTIKTTTAIPNLRKFSTATTSCDECGGANFISMTITNTSCGMQYEQTSDQEPQFELIAPLSQLLEGPIGKRIPEQIIEVTRKEQTQKEEQKEEEEESDLSNMSLQNLTFMLQLSLVFGSISANKILSQE